MPRPVALPIVAVQQAHERIREAAERLARQESDRSTLLAQLEDRVTARTGELAASEARFRLLAETTTDMIVLVDADGGFRYVSPAAETLVGARPETLIGCRLSDLTIAADLPEVVAFKRALLDGETVAPCIFRLRAADGRIVWVEAAGRRVSDEEGGVGPTGSVITLRDVSERKADEERIARAAAAAQAADRAKSEFLARMSHELRTPLNAVMGFAELLTHDRSLNAAQSEWAGHIVSGGRQLLRLIEDVLDLARIEAGRLKVEIGDVAVAPLLEEAMHMLRPAAEAHGVRLTADPVAADVVVRADRGRLLQVLLNLGSNAIKYNRAGGHVRLSVGSAPATGDAADEEAATASEDAAVGEAASGWLRFVVADDGPGIPVGKLRDIFRPFSRLNEGRGRVKGTGIGLSITQQLVGLMHGRIDVVSDTGQGAVFTVHLPGGLAAAPTGAEGQADASATTSLDFSILYIEDTDSATQLMHAIVGFIPGARLLTAASGIEGVRMAQDSRPDCIITDIRLPDLDGFKVLAALRNHPTTADIPVIAVSGEAMPDSVALGRSVGFFAYVTKPFRLDDLIEVLGAVRGRVAGRTRLETAA
ncbi:multi-sensor hybrid histidine kinase [Acidisphaera rubrifaciens HS-AP3]|uniref:histidine kinase n=1 Tax=Acidisphaera rubrifaciens HS-AP3 TaxID=1231350 RepID=A0A0D6P371_9PROT|nr:multi-sensor hybrid histidine kinase [Acidisphaera rubrifaciens HS-AP3]